MTSEDQRMAEEYAFNATALGFGNQPIVGSVKKSTKWRCSMKTEQTFAEKVVERILDRQWGHVSDPVSDQTQLVTKLAFDRLLAAFMKCRDQRNTELDRIYALGFASALITSEDARHYDLELLSIARGDIEKKGAK